MLANFGFDTTENEPAKNLQNSGKCCQFAARADLLDAVQAPVHELDLVQREGVPQGHVAAADEQALEAVDLRSEVNNFE